MKLSLMSERHQQARPAGPAAAPAPSAGGAAPWAWTLGPGEAATLDAEPQARWLRVEGGSVWVTRTHTVVDADADDIWLQAGETLALPAGSRWVLQGWPQARLSLLLQPAAALSRDRGAATRTSLRPAWWRRAWLRS